MDRSRNSVEFAKYRLQRAKETLESAIALYDRKDLIGANLVSST